MCSVQDPAAAFAEIKRVLAPGGEYRFADHVRYANRFGALVQDVFTPLWSRLLGGGCHPNRDIASTMSVAGFTDIDLTRGAILPPIPPMLVARPHIHGVAHR
jgi:hypothetical protein